MKKMMFTLFMLMVVISASAQIIVGGGGDHMRLDINGDGVWDQEVSVRNVPGAMYMRYDRNFYSELGRVYIINQWRQYEAMGVNPANYLPNPSSNADFSQYAGAYMPYVGGGMVGGAGYGMPGNVSVSVGGRNFGFGISVPVRGRNSGYGYTPNASVGVRVNGNHFGVSVPVSIVKKNKKQSTRTIAPQTRTRTQMSNDEIQKMMNDSDYM